MPGDNQLVTVFRSADARAREQAGAIRQMLAEAKLSGEVYDDSAPGVPAGFFEVRVPVSEQNAAESIIAAYNSNTLDTSDDLNMVTVFSSDAADGEMITTQIRSILDAHEIPSILVSGSMFPSLAFEVRVPKELLEEAKEAIAEAESAGPAAADEAEQESESGAANG